jgi:pimeloyl-ACP methyl ester carboxylesterase
MATYVLVGGAWLGAWAWRDVTTRLRAHGHEVYPLSLTGLGDREHLASPSINLDTHVADIVTLLTSEDLRDVILVAHSYSTMPVTVAVDRAADRIGQVVYVDTSPRPNGTAFFDGYRSPLREKVEEQVKELGDGWRWPMPSFDELENAYGASMAGVTEAQRAYLRAHASDQPFGTFTQPMTLTRPASAEPLPKLGVLCSFTEAELRELIVAGHPWGIGMQGPEWRFVDLPTGHWPMFSRPAELAAILDEASRQAPIVASDLTGCQTDGQSRVE